MSYVDANYAQGMHAHELFEEAIEWLRENYDEFGFDMERDVVWTIKTYLVKAIKEQHLAYDVFSGYSMTREGRRSQSADLVIRNADRSVEVVAEFKYEPSHRRTDIQPQKLPVVFWGEAPSERGQGSVGDDVERIRHFVEAGKANVAYALFIDESGHFRHRRPFPGSRWIDWEARTPEGHKVSILWSRWPEKD